VSGTCSGATFKPLSFAALNPFKNNYKLQLLAPNEGGTENAMPKQIQLSEKQV